MCGKNDPSPGRGDMSRMVLDWPPGLGRPSGSVNARAIPRTVLTGPGQHADRRRRRRLRRRSRTAPVAVPLN